MTRSGPIRTLHGTCAREVSHARLEFAPSGLVVGEDRQGRPFGIRLFHERPSRLLAVGTAQFGLLLGFRALALGARISVRSADPARWGMLMEHGAEMEPYLRAPTIDLPVRPELVILDATNGQPANFDFAPTRPWTAALLLRNTFTPADAPALGEADLTFLQPLPPAQAALVAAELGASADVDAASFERLPPGFAAVVTSSREIHQMRWSITQIEEYFVGDPARPVLP